jgi:hypothetical protein
MSVPSAKKFERGGASRSTTGQKNHTTPQAHVSRKNKKQKRRVHFAREPPQVAPVVSRRDMSEEEFQQRYWTPEEFETIKTSARLATRDIVKYNKRGVNLIDSVYKSVVSLTNSLDDEQLEALMNDPSELARSLHAWQSRAVGRGLEKYASLVHREDRAEVAEESRCSVLSFTQSARVNFDEVASFYKEQARSAALYARLVGEADAQVLNDDTRCRSIPATSEGASIQGQSRRRRPVLTRQLGQCFDTRLLQESVPV